MATQPPAPNLDPDQDFRSAMQRLIAARWVDVWKLAPRVLKSNDPEHVHELRVASRRLRAAMDVGQDCFPPRGYRPLHRVARRITAVTGEIRDCDVQLNALRDLRKQATKPERIGVAHLVKIIESRRDAARTDMERFLNKLGDENVKRETRRLFSSSHECNMDTSGSAPGRIEPVAHKTHGATLDRSSGRRVPALDPDASLDTNARLVLGARGASLFDCAGAIPDPARVDELHQARIAAKRLRYTIELFPEVFGDDGLRVIEQIRLFQEDVGQVHDLDVRIQLIAGELRSGTRPGKRKQKELHAGLLDLLQRMRAKRVKRHIAVVAGWQELVDDRLEERLMHMSSIVQPSRRGGPPA